MHLGDSFRLDSLTPYLKFPGKEKNPSDKLTQTAIEPGLVEKKAVTELLRCSKGVSNLGAVTKRKANRRNVCNSVSAGHMNINSGSF